MKRKQFVTVDGLPVEIEGERNLLELIRKAGIEMPTFCYHSKLSIYGACRMCMVENERGVLEAACSTPPRDGMNIRTNTARLRRYRRNILELVLSNHCRDCTTCAVNTDCKLQELASTFRITGVRFPNNAKSTAGEDPSSPCLDRDNGKCILCGDCVRVCHEVQNVGAISFAFRGSKTIISTAFNQPLAESPCVGCGQCAAICPTGAISVKSDVYKVLEAIDDPKVKVSVQIAPAVRVALGKALGLTEGENAIGKIVAALRRIGFDKVYDTSLGADLTVVEESEEFLDRLAEGGLPIITSCCPAWIQYCEKKHPELLPYLSTARSPMEMFASILRDQDLKSSERTFHVAVMPCVAKKFEANRPEFRDEQGRPIVDAVITTRGLIRMIKEAGLVFNELAPEAVDMPFGEYSGAGVIFGVTGGVTEAVLRRVVNTKTRPALYAVSNAGQRGLEGIKEFTVPYGDKEIRIAVVSGLGNAEKIIQRLRHGEHFDLVEVMACPGGCINGAGQPFVPSGANQQRAQGLYSADMLQSLRRSEENPLLDSLYTGILKGRVHQLLHVDYTQGKECPALLKEGKTNG